MKILDLSAGHRGIWFDKAHPCATFVDIRPEVNPDVIADTRALPAEIGDGYVLIVFDPPHKNNSPNFGMARSYGCFNHEEIRSTIGETAKEAHRVARDDALMAFKWNDHSLKLTTVLRLLHPFWEPLFGHGVTHQQKGTAWVMLRRVDYFNPGAHPLLPADRLTEAASQASETPECSICGARVHDARRTLEQAKRCELPPTTALPTDLGAS